MFLSFKSFFEKKSFSKTSNNSSISLIVFFLSKLLFLNSSTFISYWPIIFLFSSSSIILIIKSPSFLINSPPNFKSSILIFMKFIHFLFLIEENIFLGKNVLSSYITLHSSFEIGLILLFWNIIWTLLLKISFPE